MWGETETKNCYTEKWNNYICDGQKCRRKKNDFFFLCSEEKGKIDKYYESFCWQNDGKNIRQNNAE